jgi:FkbM family methyltransferase
LKKASVISIALKVVLVSFVLAICGTFVIFGLAPSSPPAMDAALRIAGVARGVVKTPELLRRRNTRCSVADALSEATSSAGARRKDHLERNSKILRRDGAMELLSTPTGEFWIQQRDHPAIIEELAEQTEDVYGLTNQIHRGDVVLDCGANVGVVTRRALDQGASIVVAIDPGPDALACLRRTFEKEIAAGRVVLYPKGVWDKDEELVLTVNENLASTANSVALDRGAKGPTVQLTTIDHLVEELKLPRVDFIKMDIEGAEPNALRGAARTLAKFRPRLSISLEHRPTDPDTIPGLIQGLRPDYKTVCGPCSNVNGNIQPVAVFAN